jgi:hypothetical protein
MALKKEAIERLKKLGLDPEEITAAITVEEEKDIKMPEGTLFTEAQLTARDNVKYNEGKEVGEELAVKAVKQTLSLDFSGKKVEGLAKHLIDSKPNPTETEGKLRKNVETLTKEKEDLQNAFDLYKTENFASDSMPELNNGLSKKDAIAVMKSNGYSFSASGDTLKVTLNGKAVQNTQTLEDLPAQEVITSFWKGRNAIGATQAGTPARAGRGAGSDTAAATTAPTKASEVRAEWVTKNGVGSDNSAAYAAHLQSEMKRAKEAGVEMVID